MADRRWSVAVGETMRPHILVELEAPDRWRYVYFDDHGNTREVTQDEWEALFRPGPEDQS